MENANIPVWFITGCSTGFGRELAKTLLSQGKRVVVTARKQETLEDLIKDHQDKSLAIQLDVTNRGQVEDAIQEAITHFGRIDVLVNNAGFGYLGAVEESEEKEVREMFEANFFGAARMIHVVLPHMRKQKNGAIINISSIGGFVGFPSLGYYNATKFALEGLSESLAKEVAPLGIKVMIVEPSGFRTDWAGRSLKETPNEIGDYKSGPAANTKKSIKGYNGRQPGDPVLAAKAIIETIESSHPPLRLFLGENAFNTAQDKLKAVKTELDTWQKVTVGADSPT